MGIEPHAFNLLRYARHLGHVATLGRYENFLPGAATKFAEPVLFELGAVSVSSYDCSDFEGSTFLADFNKPLSATVQYDTVLDFGSLEHIFDVAQALANLNALCRDGGQILHLSPANNFCGHGFWQVSPELFFSLYSESNGFTDTEVFLARPGRYRHWFKVMPPVNGQRVQVSSGVPLYVMCRTVKTKTVEPSVQQSDYRNAWAGEGISYPGFMGKMKAAIRKHPTLLRISYPLYHRFIATLSGINPHLVKMDVPKLIGSRSS